MIDPVAVFARRPYSFAIDILGADPLPHQKQIMDSVRDHRRTLVVASNSVGKDWIASALTCWAMATHPGGCEVVTTAPVGDQVKYIQWKEIRARYREAAANGVPLGGDMPPQEPKWIIEPKPGQGMRLAYGRATDNMEKISGVHAPYLLIIVTEGTAVEDGIYDGLRSTMASGDAHLLVITNPSRTEGECYEAAHGKREGWNVIHISAFDTPNLQACMALGPHAVPQECPTPYPFLITHEFERECARDFGVDSDYYRVHILGEWPKAAEDQVIPLEWIETAMMRTAEPSMHLVRGGLDIARMGRDFSALAVGYGVKLVELAQWGQVDLPETEGRALRAFDQHTELTLAVDDTGLVGVASHLRNANKRVIPVTFGGSADDKEHYQDKVTELWMRLAYAVRDDLDLSLLKGHPIERKAIAQLTRAKKKVSPSGKIKVVKDGDSGESPDIGDALALWNEARLKRHARAASVEKDQQRDAIMSGVRGRAF